MSEPRRDGKRRLNIDLSDRQYAHLEELAAMREGTMTEVVRDSIKLMGWAEQQKAEGRKIMVKNPDGTVTEMVFVR